MALRHLTSFNHGATGINIATCSTCMDVNAAQAFSQVFILLSLVHLIHVYFFEMQFVSWVPLSAHGCRFGSSWCPAPQGRCRCGSERYRILDRPRSGSVFRTVPLRPSWSVEFSEECATKIHVESDIAHALIVLSS